MKIRILFFATLMLSGILLNAQTGSFTKNGQPINVLTAAVPFLIIGPDARAGGLGDGGVASSADANSMHWNSAKYIRSDKKQGFAISYTPWLRNLVNDINMAYLSYYIKLDKMNAIAFSLRYFSLGEIQFTKEDGTPAGIYKPNEFALDGAYSRLLSENFSLSVAGRFIYSNLTSGQDVQGQSTKAGISVAADLGLYWQREVNWFKSMDAEFAWGVLISNIGNKISYTTSNTRSDFIPTNFRVGPRLTLFLDDYNKISFQFDVNKLLVPTPPVYATDENGNLIPIPGTDEFLIAAGMNPNVPPISGMIQSWYDAPGTVIYQYDANGDVVYDPTTGAAVTSVEPGSPFGEELREFNLAIGTEYWYNDILALRAGYFWESASKGNRKYVTLGVGLRYNVFGLDFSYLIPTTSLENPLQNTLRFTLIFNFGNASANIETPTN